MAFACNPPFPNHRFMNTAATDHWAWWEYAYRRAFGHRFRKNYVDIVEPPEEAFMLMVLYLYSNGLEISAVSVCYIVVL